MTVSSETARNDYTGNDVTVEFAVTFYFLINSDVKAILYNTVTEVETELEETTHYTLTGADEPSGGTLTMITAPTSNETLTFIRNVAATQGHDYIEHSNFPADSHERALDKLTMLIQQLKEEVDRTLRQAISQPGVLELPAPNTERFLRWTASGDLENFNITDLSLYSVSPFAETLLDDTTAEAARDTLEIDSGGRVKAQSIPDRTIQILEEIMYFGSNRVDYAGNSNVDLGTGGAYETEALAANYYNKILFTLDSSGTLKSYDGTGASTPGAVTEPTLPSSEFPICLVTVRDDGFAAAGTILSIEQTEILQTFRDNAAQFVELVEDPTPQLGAELDCQAHSVGFTLQTTTGDGTTTIDWKLGNKFKFTFGVFNETFTFTVPTKPCSLTLMLIQDTVGSRTVTWPGTIKWAGGSAPVLSTAANSVDIVSFFYDGVNYYGVDSLNFS